MISLYVTGGRQRERRPLLADAQDWYEYEQGLLLEVCPETGAATTRVAYTSPPGTCAADRPQVLFKSATLHEGRLYACTQTELLTYRVPDFTLLGHISLQCFNDVHHVRPTAWGTLLAANSGLDMVVELTPGGEILRAWNTLGEGLWDRFDPQVDYRLGVNTKPHRSHPNHVFTIGEEVWATRFQQKDALCLTDPRRRIAIDIERVHDGVLHGGLLYFTSVNGCVVVVDPVTLRTEAVIDLATMHEPDTLLGWCRGILIEGDRAWVGFSSIRPTRFRENVGWVARGFRRVLPTHIACYDLARRRLLCEVDVQAHGLDAVFSILPVAA